MYEKQFIVVEAKKLFTRAVKTCLWEETVNVLVDGCKSKNAKLSELSMGYLEKLLENMNKDFFFSEESKESLESVNELFK